MHLEEKTLSSEEVYKGKIFSVTEDTVLLENGQEAKREVVHHSGGVAVVPLTTDNEVILVRQYRYGVKEPLFEIPAGKLEKDESHYQCGKRELLEETGCICHEYEYLGPIMPTPAYVSEVIHMYLAKGLIYLKQRLDENEFLDVVKVPIENAYEMIQSGQITDAKTQIGILWVYISLMERRDIR